MIAQKVSKKIVAETSSCVDPDCNGWLVDNISGQFWIRCADPRHESEKSNVENG